MKWIPNTLRKINYGTADSCAYDVIKYKPKNCVLNDVARKLTPVENMDVVVQKLLKVEDIDVFFAELTAYNYVSAASSRFAYDM